MLCCARAQRTNILNRPILCGSELVVYTRVSPRLWRTATNSLPSGSWWPCSAPPTTVESSTMPEEWWAWMKLWCVPSRYVPRVSRDPQPWSRGLKMRIKMGIHFGEWLDKVFLCFATKEDVQSFPRETRKSSLHRIWIGHVVRFSLNNIAVSSGLYINGIMALILYTVKPKTIYVTPKFP